MVQVRILQVSWQSNLKIFSSLAPLRGAIFVTPCVNTFRYEVEFTLSLMKGRIFLKMNLFLNKILTKMMIFYHRFLFSIFIIVL